MSTMLTNMTRSVVYPESPRWIDNRVWFSDVHDYRLKTVDLSGGVRTVCDVPGRPAGFGELPDGTVIVSTALDAKLSVLADSRLVEVADLSPLVSGYLNDAWVDSRGRMYVGDTGFRFGTDDDVAPGRLILRDADGAVRVVAEDLAFPNGIAISDDLSTLYVAETLGQCLTAYTCDADGSLSDRRTVLTFDFRPDGICLDSTGMVWVAATTAAKFVCVDPGTTSQSTAAQVAEVSSPGGIAVACMLAGPDREHLVLCSADTTMKDLANGRSQGRIDVMPSSQKEGGRS